MRLRDLLERETDPRPLAIVRVVVGLCALELAVLFERGPLQQLAVDGIFRVPGVSWAPDPSPGLIDALLVCWIAFAIALTLGLFARFAAAGLAVVVAGAMALDLQMYSNHLTMLAALSALMALGNPSAAWSLDARLQGPRARIPYWPVFLIMFQISTMYAYAALAKLNGSFLSGDVFASQWRPRLSQLVEPLGDPFLVTVAVLTVLVEAFLAVALWSKRLRPIAFPLGASLHIGIVLTLGLGGLLAFGALVLGTYVLFLDWQPRSRVVTWSDESAFCRRLVPILRRFDWFGVHEFVPSSSRSRVPDDAIRLEGAGERASGFDAVRMVLEKFPVTFLFAPLLRLWPIAAAGRRAFRRLVSRYEYQVEPSEA